jgi:quercetin dioxygenase-like cupin family protein
MGSWAVRIAYNELFGGVVIQQQPGEGNRKHFHPDADENWVILDGEWEWWIEGIGTQRVKKNDIIVVPKIHGITLNVLVMDPALDMRLQDRM